MDINQRESERFKLFTNEVRPSLKFDSTSALLQAPSWSFEVNIVFVQKTG